MAKFVSVGAHGFDPVDQIIKAIRFLEEHGYTVRKVVPRKKRK